MNDFNYEEYIIGCILTNNELIKELYLQPRNFLDGNCRILFSKVIELYQKDGNVDIVTIVDAFEGDEYMQTFALTCVNDIVALNNFSLYQEKQIERYKAEIIKEKMEDYENKKITYSDLIEAIRKANDECNSPTDNSRTLLSDKEILELITTDRSLLKFGRFNFLQNKIGLLENTVNVIAARTSQGKSAFALNLMNDLADNYKCLYFNMEMTEKEIYQRLVSINSQVPINNFTKLDSNPRMLTEVCKAIDKIESKKIKIYQGGKSIKGLRSILTRESREGHCIAFIDYIGYVSSNKYNQNDRERIGEVVREIQLMSKDLNITVFMIAQINRDGDDAPTLVNLKDSGELEQTAHCVMMIHNPNKNDIENQCPIINLTIPKNRSGELGMMRLEFNKPTQTFKPFIKD